MTVDSGEWIVERHHPELISAILTEPLAIDKMLK
jgi:hypothetical protein